MCGSRVFFKSSQQVILEWSQTRILHRIYRVWDDLKEVTNGPGKMKQDSREAYELFGVPVMA